MKKYFKFVIIYVNTYICMYVCTLLSLALSDNLFILISQPQTNNKQNECDGGGCVVCLIYNLYTVSNICDPHLLIVLDILCYTCVYTCISC